MPEAPTTILDERARPNSCEDSASETRYRLSTKCVAILQTSPTRDSEVGTFNKPESLG